MENRAKTWKVAAKQWRRVAMNMMDPQSLMLMLYRLDGIKMAEVLSWHFGDLLDNNPEAKNYIEITLRDSREREFTVLVQRKEGKTPTQLHAEAKRDLERLRSDLADEKRLNAVLRQKLAQIPATSTS